MKKILMLTTFLAIYCAFGTDIAELRKSMPDNKIHGYYAWAGENGILKVNIKNFRNPEWKKNFWTKHKKLVETGKRKYLIFEIVFDRNVKRKRLPAAADVEEQFKIIFESTPDAPAYPELVYAIVPSEEHVTADIPVLNYIYDHVKSKYKVPVFQWLSEPLPPVLTLKADGWIFDAYGKRGGNFYRHTQKFVLTGTPVFPILWGAEAGMDGYYKNGWDAIKKNAEEKFPYCQDLNIPILLFSVCKKHGSVNCYMSNKAPFPEMRKFFTAMFAKKFPPVKIAHPDNTFVFSADGAFNYKQNFNAFDFVDRTSVKNTNNLQVTKDGLQFKSTASVEYFFNTPDKTKKLDATFDFDGNLTAEVSLDGKKYKSIKAANNKKVSFNIENSDSFYLRISSNNALLKTMDLTISGEPAKEKCLTLKSDGNGKYFFRENLEQNLFLGTVKTDSDMKNLKISTGNISIYGKQGSATSWIASQKIVFKDKPVKEITLQVPCTSDKRNWNSTVAFGISADGKNPVWQESDHAKRKETIVAVLKSDKPLTHCYLHFKLSNSSGIYRKNVAPAGFSGYILNAN